MDRIWDDLTAEGNSCEPPAWHEAILHARMKGIEDGTEDILDLEDAWAELENDPTPSRIG